MKSVVDGDTIKVMVGGKEESIRIIGLDTPEVVDPRTPVQCFGREASAKMHELLDGKKIRLVFDPTQGDRDKYGRLLRYVDREDGLDVGLEQIKTGFAHEYTYDLPYERQAAYKQAETEAMNASAGLWSPTTCGGDTTQPAATPTAKPTATPKPVAVRTPTPKPTSKCDPHYPTICVPPPPPDLDCGQIPYRNFKVLPGDPHRFDADHDGIGCES